jgi:hypothetical protein
MDSLDIAYLLEKEFLKICNIFITKFLRSAKFVSWSLQLLLYL